MELYIMDKDFNKLTIIDEYESLLWIDRYSKPGEFEIYMGVNTDLLQYLTLGNYIRQKNSEHVMIIESVRTETNIEEGDHITVAGRSVECLYGRRIIWKQRDFQDNYFQNAFGNLIEENAGVVASEERKIPNMVRMLNSDPRFLDMKVTAQYTGDNLLDALVELCDSYKVGFKTIFNEERQRFETSIYLGTDRSYDQDTESYVIFSTNFDNIINTNYFESDKEFCNVTLVSGEGEGLDRITQVVGNTAGLERREYWTDARDLRTKDEDGNDIPIENYYEMLRQRGKEKLTEHKKEKTFDGKVDPSQTFTYGEDFFLGDIVQIRNEFGIEGSARIVEYIMSESVNNGLEYYPTFEAIQEDAEE